jgi:molybdate transport system substrate-binding protein
MSTLNILSGGAAHGLVASLTPAFKASTGFDIAGEFGAVGLMADKLRNGTPADIVILTAALVAKLAEEKLVVATSVTDVGLVETALAVRTGDPQAAVRDAADLREALLASDAIFVPDTKASTAGIHVANVLRQLGIADDVAARLKIFPNGATAMRELAASEARRPIGCTQSTEIISTRGVTLSGSLPPGCELATMYTAGITTAAAHPQQARELIGLLTGAGQQEARKRAGFIGGLGQTPA